MPTTPDSSSPDSTDSAMSELESHLHARLNDTEGFRSLSSEWDRFIAAISLQEFELLLRSMELVVLAQAFSRVGLSRAFRISIESADRVMRTLEALGVVSLGEPDAQREVYMTAGRLPALFAELRSRRNDLGMAQAA